MIKPFEKGYYLLTKQGARFLLLVTPKKNKMYSVRIIESNSKLGNDLLADKFDLSAKGLRDLTEFYNTQFLGGVI